jgi:hypothetical protein
MTKAQFHLDPKYSIRVTVEDEGYIEAQIVNPAGVPIPADEPLILLRARDHNAVDTLRFYRAKCELEGCTPYHMRGIDNRLEAFERFRNEHPERMKQPGITEGK